MKHLSSAHRQLIQNASLRFRGSLTGSVYAAVKTLVSNRELEVPYMPSIPTFWRICREVHPDGNTRQKAVTAVTLAEASKGALTEIANSKSEKEAPKQALARLNEELWQVAAQMHKHGMLKADATLCMEVRRLLKAISRKPKSRLSRSTDVDQLVRLLPAKIETYAERLARHVASLASTERLAEQIVQQADSDNIQKQSSLTITNLEAEWQVQSAGPVYEDPRSQSDETVQWGEELAIAELAAPPSGTLIPTITTSKAHAQAAFRARIVSMVANGQLTTVEAAERVRNAIETIHDPIFSRMLENLAPHDRKRFEKLTPRSIQRWLKRVKEAQSEHGTALVSVEALTHRNVHRRGPVKATEAVVQLVRSLAVDPATLDWQATTMAEHVRRELGIQLSDRTVQRVLQTAVTDLERIRARGGSEAMDLAYRRYLSREAAYANRAWLIDHSYVRQDVAGLNAQARAHPDVEFEMSVRDDGGAQGAISRQLFVTVVKDAYSRRTLALRVWTKHPGNQETLVTLHDAIIRHGVPEILYTDNGADFVSKDVVAQLQALNIHDVQSRPYTPQGRAKLERWFRFLKERFLCQLPGFRGGRHVAQLPDEELLGRGQVEAALREMVATDECKRLVKGRGMTPRELWEQSIGARGVYTLRDPKQMAACIKLLFRRPIKTTRGGVQILGRTYYTAKLAQLPIGTTVDVHYDPSSTDIVHLSVSTQRGTIYLGPAEIVAPDRPAPSFVEQRSEELAVRREALDAIDAQRKRSAAHNRLTRASREAEKALLAVAAPARALSIGHGDDVTALDVDRSFGSSVHMMTQPTPAKRCTHALPARADLQAPARVELYD